MNATIHHAAFQIMKDRLPQSGTTLGTCGVLFDEKNSTVWRKVMERSAMLNTQQLTRYVFFIFKRVVCDTQQQKYKTTPCNSTISWILK